MLVAHLADKPVEASVAVKGGNFFCSNCKEELILKKGWIVIHHFAHKPPTDCSWAKGETREHLLAKTLIRDALRARGYLAEYEVEVLSGAGDRRADVLVTNKTGKRVAIEVQHTPILYDVIETRTRGYIAADVPVSWIGILTNNMKENAITVNKGLTINQYTIRPWERWAHEYYYKELWYVDPEEETLWKGRFTDYIIDVPSTSWYNEYGEEQSAGGFARRSKKWRTLELTGPKPLSTICIGIKYRTEWNSPVFNLPGGYFAHLK